MGLNFPQIAPAEHGSGQLLLRGLSRGRAARAAGRLADPPQPLRRGPAEHPRGRGHRAHAGRADRALQAHRLRGERGADRHDGRDLCPLAGLHHDRVGLSRRHQPQPDRLFAAGRHGHAVRAGDRRGAAGVRDAGGAGPPARLPSVRDRPAAGPAGAAGAGRRDGPPDLPEAPARRHEHPRGRRACRRTSAGWRRSPTSRSRSSRARSPASSAPTARASRRCST